MTLTLRRAARSVESRWFDRTRHVATRGNLSVQQAAMLPEWTKDSHRYVPARVATIRAALRSLPAVPLSRYTFVDLGSGKGRSLFVALEFAFRRIVGVELAAALHQVAVRNTASFRHQGRDARCITLCLEDAALFAFPDGPLVIYMFNPFGPATMRAVLDNLARSLRHAPRHTLLVLLLPRFGYLVDEVPDLKLIAATRRYMLYEAYPAVAAD